MVLRRRHMLFATGLAVTLGMGTLGVINTATASGAEAAALSIPEIQGATQLSPQDGNQVTTTGVVTASMSSGYWLQDPAGDGDDATSDGIFVYVGDGQQPDVGSSLEVTGTVDEYRPGDIDGPNLAVTELTDTSTRVLDQPLAEPEPVVLGPDGRVAPAQNVDVAANGDGRTDVEDPSVEFDPSRDAIDFYETLEGMLVEVRDAEVVGPTNTYGEMQILPGGSTDAERTDAERTDAGGVRYGDYSMPNTQRLTIEDDVSGAPMPAANNGDTLVEPVVGPMHYDYGVFRFYPLRSPTVEPGATKPESTEPAAENELAVATFNVENLDPTDPAEKFDGLADAIVNNLAAPDVLALEEVQDNSGAECPDGGCSTDEVVGAGKTMKQLIAAIADAGGPKYEFTQISPENGQDGGEPTGNIREVFLYRTDRGLELAERDHGNATTPTEVVEVDGAPQLTHSPGRVDPANEAWDSSRKPLAAEFTYGGKTLFLIANHFASKGGDEPIMGRWQPPLRESEEQRNAQSAVVRDFVERVRGIQDDAKVVVLGDINDFEFSRTTSILTEGELLVDLPRTLPVGQRYSYVYQGNSQVLDHILVSPSVNAGLVNYDSVHINADFANQLSDHDPQVMRITVD